MPDHEISRASTTDGLPPAPSLGPVLTAAHLRRSRREDVRRVLLISGACIGVGLAAGVLAQALTALIGAITHLVFFGEFSTALRSPAGNRLGGYVVVVPVIGGLLVGLMARYGSSMIRGHGIPEAMERVLHNDSLIGPRVMLLKPLSAAIAIGTGGPFGAEGPIIATGGALGSFLGQLLPVTAAERKTLLAAGAAAGMAATFGSPVAAVLLAVELLLFEYRARSLLPVATAVILAMTVRVAVGAHGPFFPMPALALPQAPAVAVYAALGAIVGWIAVYVTRAVYAIEDGFGRLPLHWMWWPALGGVAVGVIGYIVPHTLGVGYDNIDGILSGGLTGKLLWMLVLFKFLSWSIALGSGTSGGTLAPLFTIGGGLGALLGSLAVLLLPAAGVDPRIAALVGMAAMFTSASRAMLASVVFAVETTWQPAALLPLIGGCTVAYLMSLAFMRHTIMTERLARRGTLVHADYAVDVQEQVRVSEMARTPVVSLRSGDSLEQVRRWIASGDAGTSHQGFPVLDADRKLVGVVTRRDVLDAGMPGDAALADVLKRPALTVFADEPLRVAVDLMVQYGVGRIPVVTRSDPHRVTGMLTRSDVLAAYHRRLHSETRTGRHLTLAALLRRRWRKGFLAAP